MTKPKKYLILNEINLSGRSFIWLFISLVSGLLSCGTDDIQHAEVEADLVPYFESFTSEAQSRGMSIDVMDSSLVASLSTSLPLTVVGQCQHNSALPDEIKISKASWLSFTHLEREYVIFHELGHCILQRSHDDSKDSKGNCLSIMESGLGTCRRTYSNDNRTTYLDELFSN